MPKLIESRLLAGWIYGDNRTDEYVYLPAGEMASSAPLLLYEKDGIRQDLDLSEALSLIERRSLHPVRHPFFGHRTI